MVQYLPLRERECDKCSELGSVILSWCACRWIEAVVKIFDSKACHLITVLALPVDGTNWDPWFTSEKKNQKKKRQQEKENKNFEKSFKKHPFHSHLHRGNENLTIQEKYWLKGVQNMRKDLSSLQPFPQKKTLPLLLWCCVCFNLFFFFFQGIICFAASVCGTCNVKLFQWFEYLLT